jgi:predicted ATP-grasp superfamily ATP-dependent carboligase
MIHLSSSRKAIRLPAAPLACVIGDISMVRALGCRGIPVAIATATPDASIVHSRYCRAVAKIADVVDDPAGAVAQLIAWARAQPTPPVLFYQGDHDLLALSRRREAIAPFAHVLLPPADLVEACVDKARFHALAERHALPVPLTRILPRGAGCRAALAAWRHFPCVLKPALRTHWFRSNLLQRAGADSSKALLIRDRAELERLQPLIDEHGTDLVLQALVAGGEERIVSYHAYVRPGGQVVGEFTGRKLRTAPRRHGVSTYVEITDDPVLVRIGRDIVDRLRFHGVLKMDFKVEERTGRLHLFEINPRFNLWHHPATIAGVPLPELVYRDCLEPGSARLVRRVRAGVRWLSARADRRALQHDPDGGDVSQLRWLWQFATATINEDFRLHDPLPALTELYGTVRRRLRRAFTPPTPSRAFP